MNARDQLLQQVAAIDARVTAALAGWEENHAEPGKPWNSSPVQKCRQCGRSTRGTLQWSAGKWTIGAAVFNYDHLLTKPFCTACHPTLVDEVAAAVPLLTDLQARARAEDAAERQASWRASALQAVLDGVGPRLGGATFANFDLSVGESAEIVSELSRWANEPETRAKNNFIILTGPPGLGKTHLAIAALKTIGQFDDVKFVSEADLNREWNEANTAQFTDGLGGEVDALIESVKACPMLVVDDLGKVRLTEAWERVLFEVIDHRWRHMLPTIITSNFDVAQLAGRLGEPITDRLLSGVVFEVVGQSRRKVMV